MVEAVHPHGAIPLLLRVAVPALPDRGRALVDGVEPARELVLQQKRIGELALARREGQRRQQDRRSQETRLQPVAMRLDVRHEVALRGLLRRRVPAQPELQHVQVVALTAVLGLELAVRSHVGGGERAAELRLLLAVVARGLLASGRRRHFAHERRHPHAEVGVEHLDLPSVGGVGGRSVGPFPEMLERQPVAVVDPVRLVVPFEEIHVPRHRLPLPVDDSPVAVPLPQAVGDDHPGVRPARARPVREHMAHVRHEAGVQAVGILPVGEVGQVLREERMRVGEVGGAVHEHLRVGRPAEALVALRTVRRHREVVRVEPPADVGDQAVHAHVSRDEPSGLHLLGDGRDGSRTPVRERHGARRRHREVAEPEERMARHVGLRALTQRVADAGVRAAKRR